MLVLDGAHLFTTNTTSTHTRSLDYLALTFEVFCLEVQTCLEVRCRSTVAHVLVLLAGCSSAGHLLQCAWAVCGLCVGAPLLATLCNAPGLCAGC